MRIALTAVLMVGLSGCAEFWEMNSQNPALKLPPADASEYAPYEKSGNASISGQAFLVTTSGDAKKAAGKEVTCDPATSLSRRWWNDARVYERIQPRMPDDPKFLSMRKTVTADADGRFTFDNLPAGDYLIRTTIEWEPLHCGEPGYSYCSKQAGAVGGLVHVNAGEKKNVIFGKDAVALPDWTKK
ncbi:MAG TPA: hypothetical protein VFB36_06135 [Nevskiaceae bacterium]|nr:hypothetical protein [Nevskiaceae bacterium]